jgi:3-oxoacyl-[acyl-carrier protein] reductase
MKRFSDKTVLVTGASRGLGRCIAVAFAREGAHVLVAFKSREREASETLAEIEREAGSGTLLCFDVADRESVGVAVERAIGERGALDVLVNCAAVARDNRFPLLSPEEWHEPIDVNLSGTFHCCRAVAPHMIAANGGVIVNVSSVAGLHASPGQASYSASKGGLLALTRTLAAELAAHGIRVNAVVPGLLDTGMAARLDRRLLDEKMRRIPLGRLGRGSEAADVVLFLASESATYLIGQAIVVDGGLTL